MGRATEALVYVTSGRKLPPDVLNRFAYLSDAQLAKLDRVRRRLHEGGGAQDEARPTDGDEAGEPP